MAGSDSNRPPMRVIAGGAGAQEEDPLQRHIRTFGGEKVPGMPARVHAPKSIEHSAYAATQGVLSKRKTIEGLGAKFLGRGPEGVVYMRGSLDHARAMAGHGLPVDYVGTETFDPLHALLGSGSQVADLQHLWVVHPHQAGTELRNAPPKREPTPEEQKQTEELKAKIQQVVDQRQRVADKKHLSVVPDVQKLGKSEREKQVTEVASVAPFRADGKVLFGLRGDDGKWNFPGGHLEPGESAERGAVRELMEESGLKPKELEHLGTVELKGGKLRVHCYRALVEGEPTAENDPDEEIVEFRWEDPKSISKEILGNLHNKKDATLDYLGVEYDLKKMAIHYPNWSEDEERRSVQNNAKLRHMVHMGTDELRPGLYVHEFQPRYGSPMRALIVSSDDAPPVDKDFTKTIHGFTNGTVDKAGYNVGATVIHPAHQGKGIGTALYDYAAKKYGRITSDNFITPKARALWQKFATSPDHTVEGSTHKDDTDRISMVRKSDWDAIVAKVKAVGDRIKELSAQNPKSLSFSHPKGGSVLVSGDPSKPGRWRATRISEEGEPTGHIESEDLQGAIKHAHHYGADILGQGLNKAEPKGIPVQHYSGVSGLTQLDPRKQGTGQPGPEKNRGKRIPRVYLYTRPGSPETHISSAGVLYHGELPAGTKLYDMGSDELRLLEPKWVSTRNGMEYRPADLDGAERSLAKKGYHGYFNYGVPDAIAYFHPVKVKQVSARKSEGYELQLETFLAKAQRPEDFKSVVRALTPEGRTLVNHEDQTSDHPPEMNASVERYKQGSQDSPQSFRPIRKKRGTLEGITSKVVYEHPESGTRFMVKPYHERVIKRTASWQRYPMQGWAEMAHQALYNAAGIGHLHQKVHVSEHDMGEGHEKEPALVVHLEPGMTSIHDIKQFPLPRYHLGMTPSLSELNGPVRQEVHDAAKVGLMDFLTNNNDRHGGNLLVSDAPDEADNRKVMAIDHSRSFQYMRPAAYKWDSNTSVKNRGLEDNLKHYLVGVGGIPSAVGRVIGDPSANGPDPEVNYKRRRDSLEKVGEPLFEWWSKVSPKVKESFKQQLAKVKDPEVRAHMARNFGVRAHLLDQMADFGPGNFGDGNMNWYNVSVPHYMPGQSDEVR